MNIIRYIQFIYVGIANERINKAIDSVYKPVSQGPRFGYGSLARTYFPGVGGKEYFNRILLTLSNDFQNPYI